MGVFLQFASLIAYTGWALYVWVHVKTFGSQPECNDHIKYMIMYAIPVRATVPWLRGLWMAVLIMSSVMLAIIFVWIFLLTIQRDEEEEWDEGEPEVNMETIGFTIKSLLCVIFFSSFTQC
jgi:hypothetical protein